MLLTEKDAVAEHRGLVIYEGNGRLWAFPSEDGFQPLHAKNLKALKRQIDQYFTAVRAILAPNGPGPSSRPRRVTFAGKFRGRRDERWVNEWNTPSSGRVYQYDETLMAELQREVDECNRVVEQLRERIESTLARGVRLD